MQPIDVVVVGAGMAGLVAAVAAAHHSVRVLILEKGPQAGGSMALSGGLIWSYASLRATRADIPDGNGALQELVVTSLEAGFEWLAEQGIELEEAALTGLGDRKPSFNARHFDPSALTKRLIGVAERRGCRFAFETPMTALEADPEGGVVATAATEANGTPQRFRANSVILATGGFQGNATLLREHLTPRPERLRLRANPWSSGDGFLAATRLGAATTAGLDSFYGHNMAANPATIAPEEFLDASMKFGRVAVAVDRQGNRFSDESESYFGETLAQDTAALPEGQAYYLLDQALFEAELGGAGRVGTMVTHAAALGGATLKAKTLVDLEAGLNAWGVDGHRARATLSSFNVAVRNGAGERLTPPRRHNLRLLESPPYYAVAVQPGITFTMGGLAVDRDMRVLARSDRAAPIRGLYAAGVDVGNISHRRYLGGLAQALVSGRIAGDNAARHALRIRQPRNR